MKPPTTGHVTLAALAVLTVVVAVAAGRVADLDGRLAVLVRQITDGARAVQRLEEDVTRPDGRVTHVVTERREGETDQQFRERHDAMVRELQRH